MQNMLIPHPHVVVKNQVGYLSCGYLQTEEQGGPGPHRASQPRAQMLGRKVLTTTGCENQ